LLLSNKLKLNILNRRLVYCCLMTFEPKTRRLKNYRSIFEKQNQYWLIFTHRFEIICVFTTQCLLWTWNKTETSSYVMDYTLLFSYSNSNGWNIPFKVSKNNNNFVFSLNTINLQCHAHLRTRKQNIPK
jgi:hypothetical protein